MKRGSEPSYTTVVSTSSLSISCFSIRCLDVFINTVSDCLIVCYIFFPPSGKHRAGWGLDEPCEDFLKDYNKIKEVKKTTKKHIEHGPDSDKPRLFGVAHVKDYEDLVGLE